MADKAPTQSIKITSIPMPDEFYNILYDQLYKCVKNILFDGNPCFTIIFMAYDMQYDRSYISEDNPVFIYAGLSKQEELLKKIKEIESTDISMYWNVLKQAKIIYAEAETGSNIFKAMREKHYNIEKICKIHRLSNYFQKPAIKYEQEKKAEKNIIKKYFNIDEDLYLSFPLFGYTDFDGMVYIIFKRDVIGEVDLSIKLVKSLLRSFIQIYDDMFLRWDNIGESVEKISKIPIFVKEKIRQVKLLDDKLGATILDEIDIKSYYEFHRDYFLKCLELGEIVPGKLYQQYITQAVTAILVDSYAHNISAHALTALTWWFQRRAKLLEGGLVQWGLLMEELGKENYFGENDAFKDFKYLLEQQTKAGTLPKSNIGDPAVVSYPGSLDREVATLLRFLAEKGAYWSGVSRDASAGGSIISLYNILWRDLINNPLYIGTIAQTENIQHIRIKIYLYEAETPNDQAQDRLAYHQRWDPKKSGIFAGVNLANPQLAHTRSAEEGQDAHEDRLSDFVYKGKESAEDGAGFECLRTELKKIKIFLPGGLVGKHALLTMLENEIRNAKHYTPKELEAIREEGLTLALGIQPCNLYQSKASSELYRISIWLEAPTQLYNEKTSRHLLDIKWDDLTGELFDPKTYAPRLGGTQQDKVCAGYLINGKFSDTQRGDFNLNRDKSKDSQRDKHHYPWIRPACSPQKEEIPGQHLTHKISSTNGLDTEGNPVLIDGRPPVSKTWPARGFFKKIFYVWRGDHLCRDWRPIPHMEQETAPAPEHHDNPSRYCLVHVAQTVDKAKALFQLRRKEGVVRVVYSHLPDKKQNQTDEEYEEACYQATYQKWLCELLGIKPNGLYVLRITDKGTPALDLILRQTEDGQIEFKARDIEDPLGEKLEAAVEDWIGQQPQEALLHISHKGDFQNDKGTLIEFRSHGIYRDFFPSGIKPNHQRMTEFFELMATKVCVFDNRLYQRADRGRRDKAPNQDFMRGQLKLAFYQEATVEDGHLKTDWLQALPSDEDRFFVKQCHFLVMHLSYIEAIIKADGGGQDRDSVVVDFIEKHIEPWAKGRNNFFLVITTGRGRNEWWNDIAQTGVKDKQQQYALFTLFRPVEALLSAVEQSSAMQDDVELKYRFVKVLYGS